MGLFQIDIIINVLFRCYMDAFFHNWTNPQKFVLRYMQLKFIVYYKFKKANEQNIELN